MTCWRPHEVASQVRAGIPHLSLHRMAHLGERWVHLPARGAEGWETQGQEVQTCPGWGGTLLESGLSGSGARSELLQVEHVALEPASARCEPGCLSQSRRELCGAEGQGRAPCDRSRGWGCLT